MGPGLSSHVLLLLELCLPVDELLSAPAGVCPVSQSQALQPQGLAGPILPRGWQQAGPYTPIPAMDHTLSNALTESSLCLLGISSQKFLMSALCILGGPGARREK